MSDAPTDAQTEAEAASEAPAESTTSSSKYLDPPQREKTEYASVESAPSVEPSPFAQVEVIAVAAEPLGDHPVMPNIVDPTTTSELEESSSKIDYATLGDRFLAYIYDLAVIYFIVFGLYFLSGFMGAFGKAFLSTEASASALVFWLVLFSYMITSLMLTHSTVGKYAFGLEVACEGSDAYSKYPSFGRVLLRETFGRIFSSFFFGVGYWRVSSSPMKQAWSDQLGKTVVRHRPVNTALKRALSAFAVIALFLDIGFWIYGNWSEERSKLHATWESEVARTSENVQTAREAANEIIGREPGSLQEWQTNMNQLLPALDVYDQNIEQMKDSLQRGERDDLFESEVERHQALVLLDVLELRKKQIAKQREEARMVIDFDSSRTPFSDLQSSLRLLDSDIGGIDKTASERLAEIGIK